MERGVCGEGEVDQAASLGFRSTLYGLAGSRTAEAASACQLPISINGPSSSSLQVRVDVLRQLDVADAAFDQGGPLFLRRQL